eukprot:s3834_g3.t1
MEDFKNRYPQVPNELVARIIPSGKWQGDSLPWNRRMRRRFQGTNVLIIHLFSGENQKFWTSRLNQGGKVAMCLDKAANPAQDLLNDEVASYLAYLCDAGLVESLLGGPPCRTVSALRFRPPGPPPVRSREGPERFGLENLSENLKELVMGDSVLFLRQL